LVDHGPRLDGCALRLRRAYPRLVSRPEALRARTRRIQSPPSRAILMFVVEMRIAEPALDQTGLERRCFRWPLALALSEAIGMRNGEAVRSRIQQACRKRYLAEDRAGGGRSGRQRRPDDHDL